MRHIKALLLFFSVAAVLTGCLKKNDANIDGSNLSAPVYTMEWIQPGGTAINSGLQYFANGALTYPASHTSDTAYFNVRLTGAEFAKSDITVTIAPDPKALLDNFKVDGITYEAMPDSLYKIISTTGVIKKGTGNAAFKVVFYPSKINATRNYMLAPAVTSPNDYKISSNFGHVYFHTIGNLFAGAYKVTGTRYNYTGSIAWNNVLPVPAGYGSTNNLATTKTGAPNNGKTFQLLFSNLGSTDYQYIITSNDVAKTISVDYTFTSVYSNFQTSVINLVYPTATTKASFEIITHYNNATGGAGNDRIIDEIFVQQ
jgi:Domain of unknown function (DUF1735)